MWKIMNEVIGRVFVYDSLLFLGGHILKESEVPNVRSVNFQPSQNWNATAGYENVFSFLFRMSVDMVVQINGVRF